MAHGKNQVGVAVLAAVGVVLASACCPRSRAPTWRHFPSSDLTPRPTILVTHPTRAFLDSLAYLRTHRLLPQAHLIFIIHRNQRRGVPQAERMLRARGFRHFELIELDGFPRSRSFYRRVQKKGIIHPDAWVLRFRMSPRRYLPAAWRYVFQKLVDRTDALFLPGGSNIPAAFYGERQYVESVSTTPVRALYELSLLRFLLDGPTPYLEKKPHYLVLGICRGHQAINVALGGTLYQSIPVEVYKQRYIRDILEGDPDNMHRNYHLAIYPAPWPIYRGWFHGIVFRADSVFFARLDNVYLVSNHEQAIKALGRNLKVVATSTDGKIIEVIQHTRYRNVLGIQGHPERPFGWRRFRHFPKTTERFHRKFWFEVRKVLLANFRKRTRRGSAR